MFAYYFTFYVPLVIKKVIKYCMFSLYLKWLNWNILVWRWSPSNNWDYEPCDITTLKSVFRWQMAQWSPWCLNKTLPTTSPTPPLSPSPSADTVREKVCVHVKCVCTSVHDMCKCEPISFVQRRIFKLFMYIFIGFCLSFVRCIVFYCFVHLSFIFVWFFWPSWKLKVKIISCVLS